MLNVPADSRLVSEALENPVLCEGLWQRFLKDDVYDEVRNEIETKRWEYLLEKNFQMMWIMDNGLSAMINMWAAKDKGMKKTFGEQAGFYGNEEPPMTQEEYEVIRKSRAESYRNERENNGK